MNLTAKMGFGVLSGAAFFMLQVEYQFLSIKKQDQASDHAYAPWPIVFETIRKGSSLGSGASWECAIDIAMVIP